MSGRHTVQYIIAMAPSETSEHNPADAPETLEQLAAQVLANLADAFVKATPGGSLTMFVSEVLKPMSSPGVSGSDVFKRLESDEIAGRPGRYENSPLMISAAYHQQSVQRLASGDREAAWFYMAEAMYWCALTRHKVRLAEVADRALTAAVKEISSMGGIGRASRYEPIKRRVAEFVGTKETWPSAAKVVKDLLDGDPGFRDDALSCGMKETRLEKTLEEWVSGNADFRARHRPA